MINKVRRCEECGKIIKKFHNYKDKRICYNCWRKYFHFIGKSKGRPRFYEESLKTNRKVVISLTNKQLTLMDNRMKEIYGKVGRYTASYVRELVLADTEAWQSRGGNEVEKVEFIDNKTIKLKLDDEWIEIRSVPFKNGKRFYVKRLKDRIKWQEKQKKDDEDFENFQRRLEEGLEKERKMQKEKEKIEDKSKDKYYRKYYKGKCIDCGKLITFKSKRCKSCFNIFRKKHPEEVSIIQREKRVKKCLECGKEFIASNMGKFNESKFCSIKCRTKFYTVKRAKKYKIKNRKSLEEKKKEKRDYMREYMRKYTKKKGIRKGISERGYKNIITSDRIKEILELRSQNSSENGKLNKEKCKEVNGNENK